MSRSVIHESDAKACEHSTLLYEPSSNANEAGFRRATAKQRAMATTPSGRLPATLKDTTTGEISNESRSILQHLTPAPATFPGPLVLPEDDLSWDPKYPPQSLRSWIREKARNEVTPERNVIYLAAPPAVAREVQYVNDWTVPQLEGSKSATKAKKAFVPETARGVDEPSVQDVLDYLQAFYHGLPVRLLSKSNLQFREWDNSGDSTRNNHRGTTQPIGLEAGNQIIRIRTRPSRDSLFGGQVNLNDLLDAAIDTLPDDAYALLMLVQDDLYEDENDDFCCGRAYGGSRVAVVSMARYNPVLDERQGVERVHAWPASHCAEYIGACCAEAAARPRKRVKTVPRSDAYADQSSEDLTPLQHAVAAHNALDSPTLAMPEALSGLWLGRVCKTASHELGHCFGLDHCVYYACIMQGTANLIEDARQPPYLCPVDLAKVLRATGTVERARDEALLAFCERFGHVQLWPALGAWLRGKLADAMP